MIEETHGEARRQPEIPAVSENLENVELRAHRADVSAAREWLKENFLAYCRDLGLTNYVPSALTAENRDQKIPSEGSYKAKQFIADFISIIGDFSANQSHAQFTTSLEATARSSSGESLLCLVDACENSGGRFVLPMDRKLLSTLADPNISRCRADTRSSTGAPRWSARSGRSVGSMRI
jgi:hypothetical protein